MTVEIQKDEQGFLKINFGTGWKYIVWIDFREDNTIDIETSMIRPIKLQFKKEVYKQIIDILEGRGGPGGPCGTI